MSYDFIANVNNGWFTFSPSGHAFYSKSDEIKIHGRKNFLEYLAEHKVTAWVHDLCGRTNDAIISY